MKVKVVQYSLSYFGIVLSETQLRRLRRIASDQAVPVGVLIGRYIQKGFANTERYHFSQGD